MYWLVYHEKRSLWDLGRQRQEEDGQPPVEMEASLLGSSLSCLNFKEGLNMEYRL